jgi:LmbE family N-acetylglucosaminyl deacetylase
MLTLPLSSRVREVLCVGAHCDDIEIGCGGTLAALASAQPALRVTAVIFSSDATRAAESRAAFARLIPAGVQVDLQLHEFRDGFFPAEWGAIKECFIGLQRRCKPDLVLTHYEHDRHQDHRIVSELTWNAFRNHLVLEYEIPKFDGDLGQPNFYVPLAKDIVDRKCAALLDSFSSQRDKPWFTADVFTSIMRLRGVESRAPSGCAEAFYARKAVAEI